MMQDLGRLKDLLEQPRPTIVPAAAPSAAEPVIRLATAADAVAVGRMLHEFNTEFDSPTPSADRAARRFESLLRREDVLVVVAHLPRPDTGDDAGGEAGFAFQTLRPTPYWGGPLAQLE